MQNRENEDSPRRETGGGVDPTDVCTLPPSGLAERREWIAREIAPDALGRVRLEDGVSIEFAESPFARRRLEALVALERECCDGLEWNLGPSDVSGQLRLEIRGVNPDGPLFRDLPVLDDQTNAATGRGRSGGSMSRLSRVFAAGGVGAAVSFIVCCLLPSWLVAMFGATVAGTALSGLDDPRWIALGALMGGGLTYAWLSRGNRGRRRPSEA